MRYDQIEFKSDGIIVDNKFFHLDEIINKCNKVRIKENNLALMIIEWPDRRGFDGVKEQIVKSFKTLNRIKEIILGKEIYFGEIAGKHSKIIDTLDEDDILIDRRIESVNDFLIKNPSGHRYNYSFLSKFNDDMCDGVYDDEMSEEIKDEFGELL